MMEVAGYLHGSFNLRATCLGSSHPSVHRIQCLLQEIQLAKGRRCWPQGVSHWSLEGPGSDSSLWERLLKLDYCNAQSSDSVSSALCTNARKLQEANSWASAPPAVSGRSKCASRKGKQISRPLICLSAKEKIQRKTQNPVDIWNGPGKKAAGQKGKYSSTILSSGKMSSLVELSSPRSLLAKRESGDCQLTTIYHHPLLGTLNTDNPWEPGCELISEKWLFHSPDYSFNPQKCFLLQRSQMETRLLKTSSGIKKE